MTGAVSPRRLLAHQAERAGGRIAIAGDDPLSYGALHRLATAAQGLLEALGVRPGTRVALALPNSADFVVWLFAILQSGATVVALDPRLPPAEAGRLLAAARCSFRVAAADGAEPPPAFSSAVTQANCVVQAANAHVPLLSGSDAAPLAVQFSSGSSSEPKRILRMEGQLYEDYRHFSVALNLTEDDRYLGIAPFYHAYGVLGLWGTLHCGGCLLPVRRFMPAIALREAMAFAPSFVLMTPQMIDALSRCGLKPGQERAFATLRHVISATAPLGVEAHAQFLARFGIGVQVQYGSTETLSATLTRDGAYPEAGRVGLPFPGVEVAIFDDTGHMLPAGETGRVGVRSAACCDGYEGETGGLARAAGGFLLPGDIGFLDAAGELVLAGRDDVINVGGYKISPREIEAVVSGAFRVGFMKVMAWSRGGVPAIRAIIESSDPAITARAVTELCQRSLPAYKVPARIDIREVLPRDANGKVTLTTLRMVVEDL